MEFDTGPAGFRHILFWGNAVLIIVDAAAGYRSIPLARSFLRHEMTDEGGERRLGRTLTVAVVIYTLMNCIGYFRGVNWLLGITTLSVIFDLGAQFYLRRRIRRGGG